MTDLQADEADCIWQRWNFRWHLLAVRSDERKYVSTVHDRQEVEQEECQAWIEALNQLYKHKHKLKPLKNTLHL